MHKTKKTPRGREARSGREARVDTITTSNARFSSRCLIENTDVSNAIQYAHIMPISTTGKSKLMDSLEFSWGLPRHTLNVDSRYNIVRLSPTFHRLFDMSQWILVPEREVIIEYHDHSKLVRGPNGGKRLPIPKVGQVFVYELLASSKMSMISVHRQSDPEPGHQSYSAEADDFVHYPYPYVGFPRIFSHVDPRYVIYNSGAKLHAERRGSSWNQGDKRKEHMLVMMRMTYTNWITPVPDTATKFLAVKPRGGDDDEYLDSSSKATGLFRAPKRSLEDTQEEAPESHFDYELSRRLYTNLDISAPAHRQPLSVFSSCSPWPESDDFR